MTSKILKYSILFLAIFLWLQAYSPLIYKSSGLFPDDYRYGDLYRLSYLPQFKEKAIKCKPAPISQKFDNIVSMNLFIIGDSFTEEERVSKEDFPTEKYQYIHWAKQTDIQLDTSKRNILILETVERTFKEHFSKEVVNFKILNPYVSEVIFKPTLKGKLMENIKKVAIFCFPRGTEERLQHTLFNYDFFLWFREIKATLNLKFFERVEKKVVLSKDQKHIFYSEECDSTDSRSAFYPVNKSDVDTLISHINETRKKYLNAGFEEVYLSIIPNKVSILSPTLGDYNHLIERIQHDPRVQTPIIDTYSIFKKSPTQYYLKSDTHWNCEGRNVWLEKTNITILSPQPLKILAP